jgi:hypothetical protein
MRPKYPERVQRFMYACAKVAAIMDGKMKDTPPKPPPKNRARRVSPGGVDLSAARSV